MAFHLLRREKWKSISKVKEIQIGKLFPTLKIGENLYPTPAGLRTVTSDWEAKVES